MSMLRDIAALTLIVGINLLWLWLFEATRHRFGYSTFIFFRRKGEV